MTARDDLTAALARFESEGFLITEGFHELPDLVHGGALLVRHGVHLVLLIDQATWDADAQTIVDWVRDGFPIEGCRATRGDTAGTPVDLSLVDDEGVL